MMWLFTQVFVLCLASFVLGSAITAAAILLPRGKLTLGRRTAKPAPAADTPDDDADEAPTPQIVVMDKVAAE
jgi:hypothetical protein